MNDKQPVSIWIRILMLIKALCEAIVSAVNKVVNNVDYKSKRETMNMRVKMEGTYNAYNLSSALIYMYKRYQKNDDNPKEYQDALRSAQIATERVRTFW